jgi:hypothetical protein
VVSGLWIACQQPPPPGSFLRRTYMKEVYHTSPLNYRDGYNIAVATGVWYFNALYDYNEAFYEEEYRGARDPCDIVPTDLPAAAISAPQWPLYLDSGLIVTQELADGTQEPYVDALNLFDAFHPFASDTAPVFMLPLLYIIRNTGQIEQRGIQALAFPSGWMEPSVWFNSRVFHANPTPSTLAHELAHLLLDPQPPTLWRDNATPFLHIQTETGVTRQGRASSAVGPVVSVTATDVNRRNLIVYNNRSACRDAQFSRHVHIEIVAP